MRRLPARRPAAPFVTLAVSFVLAACGSAEQPSASTGAPAAGTPTASSPPAETTPTASPSGDSAAAAVTLGDMSFAPGELTVAAGTAVTFTNGSALPHTVTHGTGGRPAADAAFDRPISPDGGTVVITFDRAGTFEVTCKLHPSMQMRIVVEG